MKPKLVQGTKYRWDRNWIFYRVNAVLSESEANNPWLEARAEDKQKYVADRNENWTGYLIELTTPILTRKDITNVISTDKARIYPPFWLNKKSSITHAFDEVRFPSVADGIPIRSPIPDYAVKGVATERAQPEAAPMYGLRIDCIDDVELDEFVQFFLSLVRQYTKQWWVASPRNPFDPGLRIAFELRRDFGPREPLLTRGSGNVPAPWYGATATQGFVGFELLLDTERWKDIGRCITQSQGVETGLQFYLDAVDAYMGHQDQHCILNLALLFEVCENKCLVMDGRSPKSKNKQILKDPILAKGKLADTFRKIVTDRDNIAHGRRPHYYSADFAVIVEYLEASSELINRYLDRSRAYGWDRVVRMSI